MKKQAEDRRLAAIEAQDDAEYARAFYRQDIDKMRTALEVEDMIYDYFGIVKAQFEATGNHFKEEASYVAETLRIHQDVTKLMQDEYGVPSDDSEKLKALPKERVVEYLQRIRSI